MIRDASILYLLAGVLAVSAVIAAEPYPVELAAIPVSGTDELTDPVAIQTAYGFTTRTASKLAEHGDELALLDEWDAVETPHIKWAAPYANGPVRVLMITGVRNVRDAVELRQRAHMDATIMLLPSILGDAPPASQPFVHEFFRDRFAAVLEQDFDVIVMLSPNYEQQYADFNNVFDDVFSAVATKVEAGAGLVLMQRSGRWFRMPEERRDRLHALSPIHHGHQGRRAVPERLDVASPLTEAFSFALWPAVGLNMNRLAEGGVSLAGVDGVPMLATGTYGQGRVVSFAYHGAWSVLPDLSADEEDRADDWYEMVYAAQLKAMVWAAGKGPRYGLRVPVVTESRAGEAPRVAVSVGEGVGDDFLVRWRLGDPWGMPVGEGEQAAQAGEVALALPVCWLNGLHRLDLWLVDGQGRVDNWGYTVVAVDGGADLAVEPLFDLARPGDAVRYRIRSEVAGRLNVRVTDGLRRVSVDRDLPLEGEVEAAVDLGRVRVPRNRVAFTLYADDGVVVARAVLPLAVPWTGLNALDEEFPVLTYGDPRWDRHISALGGLLYRHAGFNGVYNNWHNRAYIRPHFDMGVYSITGAMSPFMKQANLERELQSSPNKPETLAAWARNVDAAVEDIRAYGGIGRVLDDEGWFAFTTYRDGELRGAQADQTPETIALMREHLKGRYGDVAALNEAWGTDFADWEEVRLIEEHEVDVLDNPSGWVECRQYMNWTYANQYYGVIQGLHAPLGDDYGVGPGAPFFTTREGGPTYRGGDFSEMKKTLRFMMAYGGPESGLYQDAFIGQPGGQKYDPPLHWRQWGSWHHLLNGADALWYYIGRAVMGPELAWRRRTEWIVEGIRDVVEGCGILVSRAESINRQVCILYSAENYALGWMFGKRRDAWRGLGLANGRSRSEATMIDLFDKLLFIQPRYITAEDIAAGALEDCKLLVLAQALALGDDTATSIREYVRNGGRVVADILPGTRERFGKPRTGSILADVFGVDADEAVMHRESEPWYALGVKHYVEDPVWPGEATWLQADTWGLGLNVSSAVPQGKALSKEGKEAPILFVNAYGEGQTLLLNFVYTGLDTESSGWHRAFGDGLRAWAGVEPSARIVSPRTGASLDFRSLRAFRRGPATLLGSIRGRSVWSGGRPILVDPSRALDMEDTARFTWDGERHVYNVREGRYLGFASSADVDLPSFHGRLLALLPYRVTGLALTTEPADNGLRVHATLETDGGQPDAHVLRLNVVSPTGVEQPFYAATRTLAGASGEFTIPFALNERPGEWAITVRDVMTGASATTTIVME